jgi:hypothetical protein
VSLFLFVCCSEEFPEVASSDSMTRGFVFIIMPHYSYSGGWSPTGSTEHVGTNWPIVPALGDYDVENLVE